MDERLYCLTWDSTSAVASWTSETRALCEAALAETRALCDAARSSFRAIAYEKRGSVVVSTGTRDVTAERVGVDGRPFPGMRVLILSIFNTNDIEVVDLHDVGYIWKREGVS